MSTQVKIKVIRAFESGIRMQAVADTMGLGGMSPVEYRESKMRISAT